MVAVALASLTLSCGGGSSSNQPSAPSAPSAPAITPANLVSVGQGSWTHCILGKCAFAASIENQGAGCASGTAVTVRFYDANQAQAGPDLTMAAVGGLSSLTIRPGQVVALQTLQTSEASVMNATKTYRLFPSWNNVVCP